MSCINCRYWDETEDSHRRQVDWGDDFKPQDRTGQRRRYAPRELAKPNFFGERQCWPETSGRDWCGEHAVKPNQENKSS